MGPHAAGSSVASSWSVCADTNGMAVNVGLPLMSEAIRLVMASTTILGDPGSVGPGQVRRGGPGRGKRGRDRDVHQGVDGADEGVEA